MTDQRQSLPFEPKSAPKGPNQVSRQGRAKQPTRQEAIPKQVANRMARRVAVFTGLPSLAGMGVFVLSYFLMTRGIADIAPGVTLAGSGFFFLLGLAGLSLPCLVLAWLVFAQLGWPGSARAGLTPLGFAWLGLA